MELRLPLIAGALVAVLCGAPPALAAQSVRVVSLRVDSGSVLATFVVGDSDLFTRVGTEAGWMSPTASCADIAGYPPSVSTYADAERSTRQWLEESRAMRRGEAPPGVMTELTTDTATVAGIPTVRLHMTNAGALVGDMWVARSLVPPAIRSAGDRWYTMLPADYWRWKHGSPGFSEIALGFGIPLRIRMADGKTAMASVSAAAPPWVAEVEQRCKSALH